MYLRVSVSVSVSIVYGAYCFVNKLGQWSSLALIKLHTLYQENFSVLILNVVLEEVNLLLYNVLGELLNEVEVYIVRL